MAFNTLETDIGTEITNSVDRGGRSAMTAPLPMGGQKITGMADPTVATDAATKNYIDALVAAFFSTGDAKLTYKTTADTGWVMANDGTLSNGSSILTATCRGNPDTQALFTLLYNNVVDAWAPVFTSNGTASTRAALGTASAAFAANALLQIPKALGRAIAIAGSGSGLTARVLGQNLGLETATLVTSNLPAYTPAGTITVTNTLTTASTTGQFPTVTSGSPTTTGWASGAGTNILAGSVTAAFAGTAQGGTSTAFSIMSPITFMNAMIKL